jgi:hypothetical protein
LEHGTNQIHDFNPGFGAPVNAAGDRTFWTSAIPDRSVDVHPGKGTATMLVSGLEVEDYFNLANALVDGPSVEATVSFDVRWAEPVTRTVTVSDPATDFDGRFLENQAEVSWSASEDGFTFVSDPASTSTKVFAEIGHEHNGTFFPGGSSAARGGREEPGVVLVTARPAALDSAALAVALVGSTSAPAAAWPAPLPPARHAGATGGTPASGTRPLQPAAAAGRLAPPEVLDHVFTDPGGRAAWDALRTDAIAWSV